MILAHIAAMGDNRTIGHNGKLPWSLPEDMKFFREKTRGRFLIMGRKTFETLPGALPKRTTLVITRQNNYVAAGATVFTSVESALEYCRSKVTADEEVFIGGGEEIYRLTLPYTDRIYLTHIHKDYPGDAHYPEVDANTFELKDISQRNDPIKFDFLRFERKKSV